VGEHPIRFVLVVGCSRRGERLAFDDRCQMTVGRVGFLGSAGC
jgi:hypothetical protein